MSDVPRFPDLSAVIVDDNAYVRRLIRDMLARVGLRRVAEASDGAEGLARLAETRPDIVILDWEMPLVTGEEFVRMARTASTSPAPTVPIIATMLSPHRYLIERAAAIGVNEILVKPFSPKALWARLDEVISKPRPFVEVGGLVRPARRTIRPAA